MWSLGLQKIEQHPILRFAGGGSRARRSRLQRFCQWQLDVRDLWYLPNLTAWRDHLLQVEKLEATTALAYLSTVRGAYHHLLRSNELRQWFYASLAEEMAPERKLALLTEFQTRLKNAVDPANARVAVIERQDEADSDHLWLKPTQAAALVLAPGIDTLKGLRDTALIALLLATGIRAAEAVALEVADLRATFGSAVALRVRSGKGLKQRLVPYGAHDWGLTLTEAWLQRAGLSAGPVFVGLRKGDHFYLDANQQPQRLSERSLEYALEAYPISIEGELRMVTPHDLRRTYARQLYLAGTDLTAIQQNMGHENQETTLHYIGRLDADQRAPDDAYGTSWLQPLWQALHLAPLAADFMEPDEEPIVLSRVSSSYPERGGYVFKIWLEDIRPQIWRRFKVPAGISFRQLHDIIQGVMGWENYHLYRFSIDFYAFMQEPLGSGDRYASELIDAHIAQPATTFFYEYDFGDSWGHLLTVEKILKTPVVAPTCLAGNRACPPEDSGGPLLYEEFIYARKNRKGRVSRKWQDRFGTYWDADAFDLKDINANLKELWEGRSS